MVLITGLADGIYKDVALEAGAIQCLSKDRLDPTVLRDTLMSTLRTHEFEKKRRIA